MNLLFIKNKLNKVEQIREVSILYEEYYQKVALNFNLFSEDKS